MHELYKRDWNNHALTDMMSCEPSTGHFGASYEAHMYFSPLKLTLSGSSDEHILLIKV